MTAGVYAIVNTTADRVYIGSSRTIEIRWSGWRSVLSRGVGGNKPLQADWTAANGGGFDFRLLEEIASGDEEALGAAEQRWIKLYAERCYNVHVNVNRAVPGSILSRLRGTRLAAGLTVRALARRAGVSTGVINNAERGRRTFGSTTTKICEALGVESLKLVSAEEEAEFHAGQARLEARLRERRIIMAQYRPRRRRPAHGEAP